MTVEEHYETGFASRCEGEYEKARESFILILEMEPNHLKARWQLALIKGFEGDFEASLSDLKTLVDSEPNFVEGRFDYGMTLIMLGNTDEACAQFEEVLRQNPLHEKAKQQLVFCR